MDDQGRRTINLQDNADDIRNLLVVLYSSVYNPQPFSTTALMSTSKLATKYARPILREFAIDELKKHMLEPIDRLVLSRDCSVMGWMSKAIDDLCWRELPITVAEAGPEPTVPSTGVSHYPETTFGESPRSPTPARNATPVNPFKFPLNGLSNDSTKSGPNPFLLGFGRFGSRPLPFRLESQPLGPSPF
ncbi:hypothetical protein B0J17DRAFT_717464 [Rhizoctonia solani]|nr:hypothetical protein B0J17DRAFT_717464 [Rhizoctonia solani]